MSRLSGNIKHLKHIRGNAVAYLALFMALGGSAYAANTIRSEDIVDGEVRSADVRDNDLTSVDVTNGSLTGADVNDNSLTSADVSGLTGADVNDNSLTSADVSGLTGADIDEKTLSVRDMGCQSGKVLGFARVKGLSTIPTFYTNSNAVIDNANNCSGNPVEVRRSAPGVYFVRFVGVGANLALVVGNQDGASTAFSGDNDNIVTVGKITSGSDAGSFRVDVLDIQGPGSSDRRLQDGKFTIMLF